MEAGIYWIIGVVIMLFVLAIMAVSEAIKAIAKEGGKKASAEVKTDISHSNS